MEYKRPRGGLFGEQRRQNGETFSQKLRSFFTIRRAGGLVVRSAEGHRSYYGAGEQFPVDEQVTDMAKLTTTTLTHVELQPELAEKWLCFEETQPDGTVSGRVWVYRVPFDTAEKE